MLSQSDSEIQANQMSFSFRELRMWKNDSQIFYREVCAAKHRLARKEKNNN